MYYWKNILTVYIIYTLIVAGAGCKSRGCGGLYLAADSGRLMMMNNVKENIWTLIGTIHSSYKHRGFYVIKNYVAVKIYCHLVVLQ